MHFDYFLKVCTKFKKLLRKKYLELLL